MPLEHFSILQFVARCKTIVVCLKPCSAEINAHGVSLCIYISGPRQLFKSRTTHHHGEGGNRGERINQKTCKQLVKTNSFMIRTQPSFQPPPIDFLSIRFRREWLHQLIIWRFGCQIFTVFQLSTESHLVEHS